MLSTIRIPTELFRAEFKSLAHSQLFSAAAKMAKNLAIE